MNRATKGGRERSTYVLRVEGAPQAKPRMTQRDRWMPSHAVNRYRAWSDIIRIAANSVFTEGPSSCPVTIEARFFIPVPPSLTRREHDRRLGVPHTLKPDLKNLIAGLEDSLNGIAWIDDSQICGYMNCGKYWSAGPGSTVLRVYSRSVPL